MSIQNRERFLNHLAEKLGRDRIEKPVQKPQWNEIPQWEVLKDHTVDELLDVLENQCKNIHTQMVRTNLKNLNEALLRVIEQYEAKEIIFWKDERFERTGLKGFFQTLGEEKDFFEWDPENRTLSIEKAESADIGITFSDYTLAESGTVVLLNDIGKGRSVSLLPKRYVALIPKSTVVPRMSQATREIHRKVVRGEIISSCINFISGPSNSADIEMNLVVGVHGPLAATYIVIDDF